MVQRMERDAEVDALKARIAAAEAARDALRGEVATLRGARSAEDVREMLCEASCVDVTDARCARIWSLLEHPATTMTTLAVIADERGESFAQMRAERDALQSRLAAAEAEWYEWKDIASVFLAATEPNQPIPVQGQIMLAQVRERARARFYARLASRPEGEVPDGH